MFQIIIQAIIKIIIAKITPHPYALFFAPIVIAIQHDAINRNAKNNALAKPTLEIATNITNMTKDKHIKPNVLAKIFRCLC